VNALQTAENKGFNKGIEKGIEKVAKSLLDVLDDQTIALKTGLSVEYIESLRI
jgi:predicted transposase/invertase (TIGR01784 family)